MRWRYTEKGELPKKEDSIGNYYSGFVLCLVEYCFDYKLLCYNTYEKCWDDDQCNDYYCDPRAVKRWIPVKEIEDETKREVEQ